MQDINEPSDRSLTYNAFSGPSHHINQPRNVYFAGSLTNMQDNTTTMSSVLQKDNINACSSSSMQYSPPTGHGMRNITNTSLPPSQPNANFSQRASNFSYQSIENFIQTAPPEELRSQLRNVVDKNVRLSNYVSTFQEEMSKVQEEKSKALEENFRLEQAGRVDSHRIKEMERHITNLQGKLSGYQCTLHRIQTTGSSSEDWNERSAELLRRTREREIPKQIVAQLQKPIQRPLPPRLTNQQVIDSHTWTPMDGTNIQAPLPLSLPQAQEIGPATISVYSAEQPSIYGSYNKTTLGSGSNLMTPPPKHIEPLQAELIDLTGDEPIAAGGRSKQSAERSGSPFPTTTGAERYRPSDASATTTESGKGKALQVSAQAQVEAHNLSNKTNPLKRKAESQGYEATKWVRYQWLNGSGRPNVPAGIGEEMENVKGRKMSDTRKPSQGTVVQTKEKTEKGTKRKRKRLDVATEAPSTTTKACAKVSLAGNAAIKESHSTQAQRQDCSRIGSSTLNNRELNEDLDAFAAALEAEFEADEDAAASEPTKATQTNPLMGKGGDSDEKEAPLKIELGGFLIADPHASQNRHIEGTDDDMGSLFNDDNGDAAPEETEEGQQSRPTLDDSDLVIEGETGRKLNPERHRQAMLNAKKGKDLPVYATDQKASTSGAPVKKRGRPKMSVEKGKVEKAITKKEPTKKPRASKKKIASEKEWTKAAEEPREAGPEDVKNSVKDSKTVDAPNEPAKAGGVRDAPSLFDNGPSNESERQLDERYRRELAGESSSEEE